ncbi:antibiotic biosynthesis monooxygenase [Rhodococcus sp. HNM0563]|uniref:putative quinol monooxygenase n=1 Tax=unclassified Rhodococcus (in: high G+C Gram-positive bacteria) TaxID=192944 RepID=UPI00146A5339|nr:MULTISPECIES: antibiotic biosynthesis monooxygenase [unclassified Rhodococcus (in: high G+C Gram-positive bacteria)]MCK0089777.1 antibiotic biosynthesis monooxygenase [Rhodococcus sp. F64268]NLU62274.1 antibiotic biosynthesis monooxygenase [Rhodococcus sp. HNM0563]
MTAEVLLSGYLICVNADEADCVERLLPRHLDLTRAELGCLSFVVDRTDDPLVWRVDERFVDEAAFAFHQQRVANSEWGRATADIQRSYAVTIGER